MSDHSNAFQRGDLMRQSPSRYDGGALAQHSTPQHPSPDAESAFREALTRDDEPATEPSPGSAPASASASAPASGIFGLLGQHAAPMATPAPPPSLLESLRELASGLMVSDDPAGRQSLRLTLDEACLPGVSVNVSDEAGACLADFECSVETSFLCLAEPARDMARELAATLGRGAVWRVRACGPLARQPGRWQALSTPLEQGVGVEAYASAPQGAHT